MSKPNFQVRGEDGNLYWISRSVAVVVIPFFECNGLIYIPLGKRSEKMTLYPGYWGIPCGFIDWGESASQAVEREVFEELGIKLSEYCKINSQPDAVITNPDPSDNETISLRFIVNCKVNELPVLVPSSEATEVKWLEVTKNKLEKETLAFNHSEIIEWAQWRNKMQSPVLIDKTLKNLTLIPDETTETA